MPSRRSFVQSAALAGIAGIAGIALTRRPPAFAQAAKLKKIGVLGLGSHNFASRFKTRPAGYKKEMLATPYGVWDDIPAVAQSMKGRLMNVGFPISRPGRASSRIFR